jgi:hypothetical protein
LPAGLADLGLFAVFAVLPLLALLGAVAVSRVLVVRVVLAGWGLTAAGSSSCRGWLVAGLRHGAPSDSMIGARSVRRGNGAFRTA